MMSGMIHFILGRKRIISYPPQKIKFTNLVRIKIVNDTINHNFFHFMKII